MGGLVGTLLCCCPCFLICKVGVGTALPYQVEMVQLAHVASGLVSIQCLENVSRAV